GRRRALVQFREIMQAPPPRWWLRAGRHPMSMSNAPYPWLRCAEVLPMNHLDVEVAARACDYRAVLRPYAVFLDEMMLDHPDLQLLNLEPDVDEARYHVAVERCFRQVEEQLGLDVIVAPHPKATPQSNERFGRPIANAMTASLVRSSSLIMCHYT